MSAILPGLRLRFVRRVLWTCALALVAMAPNVPAAAKVKRQQVVERIKRADRLIERGDRDQARSIYFQALRLAKRARTWNLAVEAMRKCSRHYPDDEQARRELARAWSRVGNHVEAEELYRRTLEEKTQDVNAFVGLVSALERQGRQEDAREEIDKRFLPLETFARSDPEARAELERLDESLADRLDRLGLLDERIDFTRERIEEVPGEAFWRNRLGDFLLHLGDDTLALSEHLLAARLNGDADRLARHAADLARQKAEAQSMMYIEALIEHFPAHPRVFELLQVLIEFHADWAAPRYYNPKVKIAYQAAARVCGRIARDDGVPLKTRAEARRRQIEYTALGEWEDRDMWRVARRDLRAMLGEWELTPEQRRHIYDRLVRINIDRLYDLQAAWRAAEDKAREFPSADAMQGLAEAASWLDDPPPPDVLAAYVEAHPDDHESRMRLARWRWRRGERDAARSLAAQTDPAVREEWIKRGHSWAKP